MDTKKGKILVLDDYRIVLDSISEVLNEEDYYVTTCQQG